MRKESRDVLAARAADLSRQLDAEREAMACLRYMEPEAMETVAYGELTLTLRLFGSMRSHGGILVVESNAAEPYVRLDVHFFDDHCKAVARDASLVLTPDLCGLRDALDRMNVARRAVWEKARVTA